MTYFDDFAGNFVAAEMKERGYIYTLTEAEKNAVKYAIDYFLESVPYIFSGFMPFEQEQKAEFQALVNEVAALRYRMQEGAVNDE